MGFHDHQRISPAFNDLDIALFHDKLILKIISDRNKGVADIILTFHDHAGLYDQRGVFSVILHQRVKIFS